MPSFYYLATFDESVAVLDDLCEQGFRVIPGRAFDRPTAPEYDRVTDELLQLLREGPGFYLAGAFTERLVALRQLAKGPAAGKYVVDALTGGPVVQGVLARDNVVAGVRTILLGDLTHQARYRNPDGADDAIPASAALRTAYRRAVSIARKHLVRDAAVKFPVGREALRLLTAGLARAKEDFLPTGAGTIH